MKPALSQVCTLAAPFEQDLPDFAAGACEAVEIWLGKLETYLETHSTDDVRRLLDECRMTAPVAAFQGGLLVSQGEARREHWDHFARRLTLCRAIGIGTLVVAGDAAGPLNETDFDRLRVSLIQAAEQAGNAGVRLALEFQARSTFPNNLESATALIADCGQPALGLCLDAFHYHVGPSKPDDLAWLTSENLFHVQLCDLCDRPRELAADSDRVLPGDGQIPLNPIVNRLREIGYAGHVSVELHNPRLWQVPPRQFGEIAMTAVRKTLGQAAME